MDALIVFESMFGNTRDVALAIAEGLRGSCEVAVVEVADAPTEPGDVRLLVVGGPTHVHGMVGKRTREAAKDQAEAELISSGPLLRDWLDGLPKAGGRLAVAFDTRLEKAEWLVGSAGKAIEKRLHRRGYRMLEHRQSFFVGGEDGALEDGQLERASEWGAKLADALADAPGGGA